MTKTALGKGFGALLPDDFDHSLLLDKSEQIQKLSASDIAPNPQQPRRSFEEEALKQLAQSILNHGILQPIIVTPQKDGKYYLIAGERRWRSAQIAGLTQVPAIVRSTKELEQLEIALVENVQRVDLSPLEQAVSILKLHEQFNQEYSDIANRLGKATSTISNIVRLLQLPEAAQTALTQNRITEGHARAILALTNAADQQELLESIQKYGWTVRQAEQFVLAHKQGKKTPETVKKHLETTSPQTKKLSSFLKAPVSLKRLAKGGKLEIGFKSDDDLERILKKLSSS